jgi:hypothetical protein
MLASCYLLLLAVKNCEQYNDSLGRIRVNPQNRVKAECMQHILCCDRVLETLISCLDVHCTVHYVSRGKGSACVSY